MFDASISWKKQSSDFSSEQASSVQTKKSSNSCATAEFHVAGKFHYLEKKYSVETPCCLVPHINSLFKSVCERYDIAVTNREKVDETLTLFKRILTIDLEASIEECFTAWKHYVTNPRFLVRFKGNRVKEITLQADVIPRERRKAQKHIRDLLDACHLYLDQKNFLQKNLNSQLSELDRISPGQLNKMASEAQLTGAERKQIPQIVRAARTEFVKYPAIMDRFWSDIHNLMEEIDSAVGILLDGQNGAVGMG